MIANRPRLRSRRFGGRLGLLGLLLLLVFILPAAPAVANDLLVFAAASLKNALDEVAAAFRARGGSPVAISYGASGALARQLENGAPADLFISADVDWMEYVQSRNLIKPGTRVDLLGNRLVLVAPADAAQAIDIRPHFPLAARLGGGRLAMGDPRTVPAGKYGKAALEKLGVWDAVKELTANADNVRTALAFVSRGEAPVGIVYATDATAEPGVKIIGVFPEDSHPPIVYPAAIVAASTSPDAARLLAFLRSPETAPSFERQGFTVLARPAPGGG